MLRALLPCFLLSCTSFDADNLSVPSTTDREGNGGDTGSGGAAEDTADWDESEESQPAWFALHGKVVLDDGLLLSMNLSLDVYAEETSDGKIEGCTVEVEGSEWETPEALPDAQIYAWWKFLTLDVSSDACEVRDRLPLVFYLGLGSLHPDLTPELVALEMDNPEQYLYGAFASFAEPGADGQQDISVFGVAGTQDNLDQHSEVAQSAPLPSGTYYITAVYLFPLLN